MSVRMYTQVEMETMNVGSQWDVDRIEKTAKSKNSKTRWQLASKIDEGFEYLEKDPSTDVICGLIANENYEGDRTQFLPLAQDCDGVLVNLVKTLSIEDLPKILEIGLDSRGYTVFDRLSSYYFSWVGEVESEFLVELYKTIPKRPCNTFFERVPEEDILKTWEVLQYVDLDKDLTVLAERTSLEDLKVIIQDHTNYHYSAMSAPFYLITQSEFDEVAPLISKASSLTVLMGRDDINVTEKQFKMIFENCLKQCESSERY